MRERGIAKEERGYEVERGAEKMGVRMEIRCEEHTPPFPFIVPLRMYSRNQKSNRMKNIRDQRFSLVGYTPVQSTTQRQRQRREAPSNLHSSICKCDSQEVKIRKSNDSPTSAEMLLLQ